MAHQGGDIRRPGPGVFSAITPVMFHATKIRLYPNAAQQDLIARQLGCVRFVWNKALDVKKVAWNMTGIIADTRQMRLISPP